MSAKGLTSLAVLAPILSGLAIAWSGLAQCAALPQASEPRPKGAIAQASKPAKPAAPKSAAPRWVELRSQNFVVVSDSTVAAAAPVVQNFELARAVFRNLFPNAQVNPGRAFVIYAFRDGRGFADHQPAELEPSLRRSGYFRREEDKHLIALRLDLAEPFRSVVHEYSHLLVALNYPHAPQWLNEAIAEFVTAAQLAGGKLRLGLPVPHLLRALREHDWLPLAEIVKASRNADFFKEEKKAERFRAESWILLHYLELGQLASRLPHYLKLFERGEDPEEAWRHGLSLDLDALGPILQEYAFSGKLPSVELPVSAIPPAEILGSRELSPAETLAYRGDLLAHIGHGDAAGKLLLEAIRRDGKLAPAFASLGLLEFRRQNWEDAERYFATAVGLDAADYRAHYFYAGVLMRRPPQADETPRELREKAAVSLGRAIALNPEFALAYDSLARVYRLLGRPEEEYAPLIERAAALDPADVTLQISLAQLRLFEDKLLASREVAQHALEISSTERDRVLAESFLEMVEEKIREPQPPTPRLVMRSGAVSDEPGPAPPPPLPPGAKKSYTPPPEPLPQLGRREGLQLPDSKVPKQSTLWGTIEAVGCKGEFILSVKSQDVLVRLHAGDPSKVEFFSRDPATFAESFNPCAYTGGYVLVAYRQIAEPAEWDGELISVEYFPPRVSAKKKR